MAIAYAPFFSLFPLLVHSRSSSLHLFRRLAIRHSRHLILSPPISSSPFLPPPRSSHQSSLHSSQPLKWEDTPPKLPESHGASASSRASHLWPEWLEFVNWASSSGYCSGSVDVSEFAEELNPEFLTIANGCLNFARDYPNLLWSLPREDIEAVVDCGSPFLFKDVQSTTRRMKSFLGSGLNDVLESDKPTTLDLMRFLLSYAHMAIITSKKKSINSTVESSVRRLFGELVNSRGFYAESNPSALNQFPERYGQAPRSLGPNIGMKRGDWICPRCSFMNFAKNMKCLECEDSRPKKYLTFKEWECPQCNFLNFSRNAVCLRCDCKKPGENPFQSLNPLLEVGTQTSSVKSNADVTSARTVEKQRQWLTKITQLENPQTTSVNINTAISEYLDEVLDQRSTTEMSDIGMVPGENEHLSPAKSPNDTRTPGQEQLNDKFASKKMGNKEREEAEKSDKWFEKVAELHDAKDLASAVSEDFPEIMPVRKGENRFVVSKKKDRSLTSPMYKRHMAMEQQAGNNKYVPFVPFPPGYFARDRAQKGSDSTVPLPNDNDTRSTSNQQSNAVSFDSGMEDKATNPVDNASNYVKMTQKLSDFQGDSSGSSESNSSWRGRSLEGSAVKEPDPLDMSEEAKSERWFRRVAQIKDISELSQIPDEDFPSIMPMRKGVNRFVVSKRKTPLERRLTSSQYRRNLPVVNFDPVKKETDSN